MKNKLSDKLIKQIASFLATWFGEQADGFVIEEEFKEVAEELYWKAIHEELTQTLEGFGEEIIGREEDEDYPTTQRGMVTAIERFDKEFRAKSRNELRAEQRALLAKKVKELK